MLKHNFPDKYIIIEYFHPLSPNVHIHIYPNWSVYISLKNQLRELHKRSKHFLFSDHFIISHNLISWKGMDIIGRKLMFGTTGTGNFFWSRKWSRRAIVCVWGAGGGGREESFFIALIFCPFFRLWHLISHARPLRFLWAPLLFT